MQNNPALFGLPAFVETDIYRQMWGTFVSDYTLKYTRLFMDLTAKFYRDGKSAPELALNIARVWAEGVAELCDPVLVVSVEDIEKALQALDIEEKEILQSIPEDERQAFLSDVEH